MCDNGASIVVPRSEAAGWGQDRIVVSGVELPSKDSATQERLGGWQLSGSQAVATGRGVGSESR